MSDFTPQAPPPDWYPDATDPTLVRYWDGSRWTDHTEKRFTPPQESAPVVEENHTVSFDDAPAPPDVTVNVPVEPQTAPPAAPQLPPPPPNWHHLDASPPPNWSQGSQQPSYAPRPPTAQLDIKGLLLSAGALGVLAGGIALSSRDFAVYLMPVFALLFGVGAYFTHSAKLRLSTETFYSVSFGLTIYELWLICKQKDYHGFGGVVEKWFQADRSTLIVFVILSIAALAFSMASLQFVKKSGFEYFAPKLWIGFSIFMLLLSGLIQLVAHPLHTFEFWTLPISIGFLIAGEFWLSKNDKISSLNPVTIIGLLIGIVPSFFASLDEPLSYHAAIFTTFFVALAIHAVLMKRSAAIYITPWFFLIYCLTAIFNVADNVAPWVWLIGGGSIVVALGVFWEKLLNETKDTVSLLKKLR